MTPRRRTWLIVTAPLVAIATLMIGARVGAGDEFHAALVYIAAPGKPPSPGAPAPYAWQLMTYLEDRGVRETIAMKNLTAVARTVDGQESRWAGESNSDGIAEMAFTFVKTPAKIGIEVKVAGEKEPLALGIIDINDAPIPQHPTAAETENWSLHPSQKSGIPMQVYVEGEALAVGARGSIWVHVSPPATSVKATPEIGLEFKPLDHGSLVCGDWVQLHVTANQAAASTLLEAKDDAGAVVGRWFGVIPTAAGGFEVFAPHHVGSEPANVDFYAPNPRTSVYVELDDDQGREFGAVLPLVVEAPEPLPQAHLTLPANLAPGPHWLVTSGNPRGAEKMSGATLARTIVTGVTDGSKHECDYGIAAAKRIAVGFPRALAIDGIATRGAKNRARHRLGLLIGLLALGAAALLEVLLLSAAAREARLALALAENENATGLTAKTPGGGLAVALLVAVLGFALLAALMIAKA